MGNKKLKIIMTDLAAGHISQKEADILLKGKKVAKNKPKGLKKTVKKEDVKTNKRELSNER